MKKEKSPNKANTDRELKKRLRAEAMRQIQPLAVGSVAMIASTLANQAVPRLLGKLLDRKSSSSSSPIPATSSGSTCTGSALAFVVLGGGVASFLRTTMMNRAEDGIASRLRSLAFRSMLTQRDMEWFQMGTAISSPPQGRSENGTIIRVGATTPSCDASPEQTSQVVLPGTSPGAVGAILNDDVAVAAKSLTTSVASLIRSACSCFFGTFHMIRLNPSLFGLSVCIVPLIGTAAMVLRRFIKSVAEKQRDAATLAASFAEERLTHVAMVKMSNRELDEVERYSKLQQESVRLGSITSLANGMFMGFIFAASSGALFVVFEAGGRAVAAGRMTSGELTSFATYTFLLGLGTSGILKAMSEMVQGMVSARRVYFLIDGTLDGREEISKDESPVKESDEQAKRNTIIDVSAVNTIALRDVSFAYKSRPDTMVLRDVSLTLQRGQVVALVGENGSGKTTIASLLAALYEPRSGRITVGDDGDEVIDYTSLNRTTQKKLVQAVPQHPALFNATILENVTYSNPTASVAEAMDALSTCGCDGFVSKLADGVQFVVGQNGSKLSGGQRQRLGLARALVADPVCLIMDEPTSSLDAEGESALADAVKACREGRGRALLLITHRPKTLELADTVVVLKEGRVVETGKYNYLSSNKQSELCRLMPELLSRYLVDSKIGL